ncbi:hypothetical protein IFU39_00250 [Paenibacillus sp. CFBP 13594]|uniref:hypothetical protein n=1 Tax=Paenibacillus sp. CFBP 13594 TaxID=2774037 RepID=UPI0017869CDC|nr:hypothetical protein [Paenibacillus sp. CFBP 13594]MBD8836249.1 hypothetical protein [Paenibacillus sp. CFBP 13594]
MSNNTKFELICEGEIVNKHSDGGQYYGWVNPLDFLPPIGSTIEYMTFNQGKNYKEGLGELKIFVVKSYKFTTEEDYNNQYHNKVCKILVDEQI